MRTVAHVAHAMRAGASRPGSLELPAAPGGPTGCPCQVTARVLAKLGAPMSARMHRAGPGAEWSAEDWLVHMREEDELLVPILHERGLHEAARRITNDHERYRAYVREYGHLPMDDLYAHGLFEDETVVGYLGDLDPESGSPAGVGVPAEPAAESPKPSGSAGLLVALAVVAGLGGLLYAASRSAGTAKNPAGAISIALTRPQASFVEIELIGLHEDDEDDDVRAAMQVASESLAESGGASFEVTDPKLVARLVLDVVNGMDELLEDRSDGWRNIGGVETKGEARAIERSGQALWRKLVRLERETMHTEKNPATPGYSGRLKIAFTTMGKDRRPAAYYWSGQSAPGQLGGRWVAMRLEDARDFVAHDEADLVRYRPQQGEVRVEYG